MADYLLTLDAYKTFAGITDSDTTNDAKHNALIAAVDAQIDTFLNWNVIQATYSDVVSGTGTNFVRLRNRPIVSISSIVTNYGGASPINSPGANFIFDPNGMVYWSPAVNSLPGYFDWGVLNIQANYTAGYLQQDVPMDIQRAAAMMIQRIVKLTSGRADADFSLDQYSEKSNIIPLSAALFEDVRMILKQYQAVRFI